MHLRKICICNPFKKTRCKLCTVCKTSQKYSNSILRICSLVTVEYSALWPILQKWGRRWLAYYVKELSLQCDVEQSTVHWNWKRVRVKRDTVLFNTSNRSCIIFPLYLHYISYVLLCSWSHCEQHPWSFQSDLNSG